MDAAGTERPEVASVRNLEWDAETTQQNPATAVRRWLQLRFDCSSTVLSINQADFFRMA